VTGTDPDADAELVLAAYGRVMLTVQLVERQLGALWILSFGEERREVSSRGEARAWRRMLSALDESTPRVIARALAAKLDKDLTGRLTDMIGWRDRLADGYLAEHLEAGSRFAAGTHRELVGLRERFAASGRVLEAMIDRLAEELCDDIAAWPAEARAVLEAARG